MPYATRTKGPKAGFDHGPSVKNSATYEALMNKGMSKSKAAAISNAALKKTGKRGRHRSAKRR